MGDIEGSKDTDGTEDGSIEGVEVEGTSVGDVAAVVGPTVGNVGAAEGTIVGEVGAMLGGSIVVAAIVGCVENSGLNEGVPDGLGMGQEADCCPAYETLCVYLVPHELTTILSVDDQRLYKMFSFTFSKPKCP